MFIILSILTPLLIIIARILFLYAIRVDINFEFNIKNILNFRRLFLIKKSFQSNIKLKYYFSIILSVIVSIFLTFAINHLISQNIEDLVKLIHVVFFIITSVLLLYMAIYDVLYYEIEINVLKYILIVIFGFNIFVLLLKVIFFYSTFTLGNPDNIIAGLILSGIFLIIVKLTHEKAMGMGDVYLMLAVGLSLGLARSLIAYTLTLIIASVSGIIFAIFKNKFKNLLIPLVPFIMLGYIIAIAIPSTLIYAILGI